MPAPNALQSVRAACRWVAERATSVHIDEERLRPYATELVRAAATMPRPPRRPSGDPADEESMAALVLQLDAVNFGSGWHPVLRKREGCSGSVTIASALRARADREGPFSAEDLVALSGDDCAALFGQDPGGPAGELMSLFARSLSVLGSFVQSTYGGSFAAFVASAGRSAAALVDLLCSMPTYDDRVTYRGRAVPFLKRAQITAHDLAGAFGGQGLGRFDDIDDLTMFADNLVPHVLRLDGVLAYDRALIEAIDAGELLAYGSEPEVEIRAVAVHAVERMAREVRPAGGTVAPREIDEVLWRRGGEAAYKAVPRHRCRTTAY
jgi:hypothetical protein